MYIAEHEMKIRGYAPSSDSLSTIYLLTYDDEDPMSDYRYKIVEFTLCTVFTQPPTNGKYCHLQESRLSCVWAVLRLLEICTCYYENKIFFFGGFQKYDSDNTGSFIYCFSFNKKEWTSVKL